jgi:diguanylate cyclase (GGDEF)-like protein
LPDISRVSNQSVPASARGAVARNLADAAEVAASRERVVGALYGRERVVTYALAACFLVAAAACALFLPSSTPFSLWVAVLFVVCYAVVSQVEFEVGPGSAVPTELVLVPMLFAVPPGAVPVLVASGLVLGGVFEHARSRRHGERLAVLLCSSWHSVGPTLVVALLAPGGPSWEELPVYALALAAQLAFDWAAVVIRHVVGRGAKPAKLVRPLAWAVLVDGTLAPVALLAAFAVVDEPVAIVCVLPVAALLHVLGAERRRRLDDRIALGRVVDDERRVARSDPLTGVGNRLAWQEAVREAQADLDETGAGAVLLLVDLNRLKETNDRHGHDVGDRLIQALAGTLRGAIPEHAVLARIGGDEFAVLVRGANGADGAVIMADIRRSVAASDVNGITLLASVGDAACPPCASYDEALRLADERLYRDKAATTLSNP